MKKIALILITSFFFQVSGCTQSQLKPDRAVGSRCEDCELMFEGMPATLSSETKITGNSEPGEPMIISGIIYKKDGKTPAPDVILYVYHTDKTGNYTPSAGQTNGKRHGHLRGWMKTDAQGHYQFTSIRPASYPNRKAPQHVHPIIKEPGTSIYWIDEYLFEDDPLLSADERARQEKRGGSGIITLTKNADSIWIGKRDIILGKNVPNY